MKIHWPHRLWCNCEPCIRWRGGYVIPDWKVEALEAKLRAADTRPAMPYLFDPLTPPMFFPANGPAGIPPHTLTPLRLPTWKQMVDEMASIFPKGSRAGLPLEWTPEDARFLEALKIDPWT